VGDVALTLPACAALRARLPGARIDYLTTSPCDALPGALDLFDRVDTLPPAAGRWGRAREALAWGLRVRRRRYDVIVDLQRHRRSRLIRRLGRPAAWAEFDRFSRRAAAERILDTFHQAGFAGLVPAPRLPVRADVLARGRELLARHGWDGARRLVVLNPCGRWETRNWPLARYAALGRLWLAREPVAFVLLGIGAMAARAAWLRRELGPAAIDLVNATSLAEDLGVLQHVSAVVSEDGGLMHVAWASGVPTVALLGSSPSVWVRPLGPRARHLGSEDLPCGPCMRETCALGDVRCLTRHAPETVLALAREVAGPPAGEAPA
jgi:ADP-heptose:LPS heptosyltransferase